MKGYYVTNLFHMLYIVIQSQQSPYSTGYFVQQPGISSGQVNYNEYSHTSVVG